MSMKERMEIRGNIKLYAWILEKHQQKRIKMLQMAKGEHTVSRALVF